MFSRLYIAVVVFATLAYPAPAWSSPDCIPTIELMGAELDALHASLAERGLDGDRQCGVMLVAVEATRDGKLKVRVTLGAESETRVLEDVAAAATFIESWARVDLADPLLAVRSVAMASEPPPPEIVTIAAEPFAHRRLELATTAEASYGFDGSTWTGLTIAACVNINIVCVGGLFRAGFDNRTGGDSKRLEASRWGLDTLFTVDMPIRLGRYSLYPGLGVGQGAQFTRRDIDGDGDELAGVRVRARLGITVQLKKQFALLLNPEFVWSPGNPEVVFDADEGPELFIYPGDPGYHLRLGLGLVVEAL